MKKDKTPSYIKIGILTVVTTIAWIFFSAYRTLTAKPAPNVPMGILDPFIPTLETEKISEIEGRIFFEAGQTAIFIAPSATPSPSVAPEVEKTPLPEETEIPIEEESFDLEELSI